ncbi:MAG: mycothiol synthase [Terrimesophilobacter sp.]
MTTPLMRDRVEELARRAQAIDDQPPFSDQSLLELGRGVRRLITVTLDGKPADADRKISGAAIIGPDEFELVVDPDSRQRGLGASLLAEVLAQAPDARSVWAHGDHPGARALAKRFGFVAVRTLLQLRAEVPETAARASSLRDGPHLSTFRPGIDDADWLTLNARAFADHPEQGQLVQRDLDDRISQDWFSPDDFLLVHDDGELIAFCWLKVEGDIGEFYAVAVDPAKHGGGLGRTLMDAGFARFAEQGIRTAALYVEADNAPALALYHRFGFTQHTIDVRYAKVDD